MKKIPLAICLLMVACSPKQPVISYVDPFWGSGATDTPLSEGMARGWNWEKAQSGNTSPAAVLPFGWMSACPFSGGYSSGYGTVGYSSCFEPPVMSEVPVAYGITHLQHSGVGLMHKFYNFFLLTPFAEGSDISKPSVLTEESAHPGYYAAALPDYGSSFELTVHPYAALHRFHYDGESCFLKLDVSQIGLGTACFQPIRPFEKAERLDAYSIREVGENVWAGTICTYGKEIYYAFCLDGDASVTELTDSTIITALPGKSVTSALALSVDSEEEALERAKEAMKAGFRKSAAAASVTWEKMLGNIRADFANPVQKRLFYSTLYHSLIKPCSWASGRLVDFATFWDMYHTALPLMLSIDSDAASLLSGHLLATVDALGFSPIAQVVDSAYKEVDGQCTAIPVYTLCDAFFRGAETDYSKIKTALRKEYAHASLEGMPLSHTLDLAGAYAAGAYVADICGDAAFADSLRTLSPIWKNVYDETTGLMFVNRMYYEGNHFNYSFRPHIGMNERVEMAGGPDKFCEMLDTFFRVGDECPEWDVSCDRVRRRDYFEGLNNEADMDTPFAYLWCGRVDRLAEVIDAVCRFRFCEGKGGCPGNNDSGGLSSWYVWNCLGLYPLSGTPYYLLGSPSVESAEFDFAGGTLEIEVLRESDASIYPAGYSLNGKDFNEPWVKVQELEKGGKLTFRLSDSPSTSPIPQWL